MKRTLKTAVAASVMLLCALTSPSAFACHVDDPAFSSSFRDDLNLDLNDYARILADSEDPNCALNADYALTAKVNNTNSTRPAVWGEWLQGASVGYIFAAANRIGANGYATKDLDNAVRAILPYFSFPTNNPTGCAKESANTCVDDYAVEAPGFAWIAAYKYRRGDDSTSTQSYRDQANSMIDNAFNEVCIRKSDATTLCNGSIAELASGTAYTLSMNHGQQMPSYGFGLMTSIAAAELGLQASGSGHTYTSNQQTIAQGLLTEMKNAVDTSGNFNSSCVTISQDGSGVWHLTSGSGCGGPDGYAPNMYALHTFYANYLGGYPSGGYQSNSPNSGYFGLGAYDNGFFSYGRYETYVTMASDWFTSPREYLPFDNYNPIGYLDGISTSGVASGWTCDQDVPAKSNHVDFYANGTYAVGGIATNGSESAVNSLCGGGTAHRFSVQLPSWTTGQTITAYGLDYTWYGFTQLTCLQSPTCSW